MVGSNLPQNEYNHYKEESKISEKTEKEDEI